jgi:hypothetical protein
VYARPAGCGPRHSLNRTPILSRSLS